MSGLQVQGKLRHLKAPGRRLVLEGGLPPACLATQGVHAFCKTGLRPLASVVEQRAALRCAGWLALWWEKQPASPCRCTAPRGPQACSLHPRPRVTWKWLCRCSVLYILAAVLVVEYTITWSISTSVFIYLLLDLNHRLLPPPPLCL